MKKYLLAIVPGILLFVLFHFTHTGEINIDLRNFGRVAFLYIVFSLSVTPLMKLFESQKLLAYRRVFGVLSFYMAIVHAILYFKDEYKFTGTIFGVAQFNELDVLSGTIGLVVIIILGITSNNFSVNLLKSFWKKIQVFAYPLFVIVTIHIAFASRFELFYIVVISALILLRTLAYLKNESTQSDSSGGRYLCVPCGYIYDEEKGDPDSGVKPGTKWEDIPESWRCPVCGVTKKNFIKLGGDNVIPKIESVEFKVEDLRMLTKDVLEISLYSIVGMRVIPGQFAKFSFSDESGEFSRSYSIVSYIDGILKFGIKIVPGGRGGKILSDLKIGDKVKIDGIYGEFVLQDTPNDKVFIATGTGLSPIVNMIKHSKKTKNTLLFGVKNIEDVFYEKELLDIPNLDLNIYLSELKEENPPYRNGRINLNENIFLQNTEFYICGVPPMVKSTVENLQSKGFKNIYFEQFN